MAHDFKKWPELTNNQMSLYYFDSPHKQITEDFRATVTKVIDGDTIKVRWDERNFDFPIRLARIAAPEMNEGGAKARSYLESLVGDIEVEILINKKMRTGKWGRIIGEVVASGLNANDLMLMTGNAVRFDERKSDWPPKVEVFKWGSQ